MAAAQRGDRRPQAGGGEELERGQHAAVDLAGADVAAAAVVDVDARVGRARAGRARPCSSAGSGRSTGSRRRRRRTGSCRRRGRWRWTRAASSRRGSASGRSAGRRGRPAGSRTAGAARGDRALPRRPRIVPATTRAPGRRRLSSIVVAAEPEDALEVALEGLRAVDHAGALELLLRAAGGRRVRALGLREQPLLARRAPGPAWPSGSRARRARPACAWAHGSRAGLVAEAAWSGAASRAGSSARARSSLRADVLRLRRRVALGDLAEVPVRVRVAVDVLEHDEAAEPLRTRRSSRSCRR